MARDEITIEHLQAVSDVRIKYVIAALEKDPQLHASDVALMVDLGPDHLERLFKRCIGTSISSYILALRLEKAATLLKTTFQSVKQIRNEVGMADATNFARQFKQRYGMSPSIYRNTIHVGLNRQISKLAD